MKTIIATVVNDNGTPENYTRLLVMTEEDYKQIIETQECDIDVHVAVASRFQALEDLIELLHQKINLLESRLK